jgi:hypothetical protein
MSEQPTNSQLNTRLDDLIARLDKKDDASAIASEIRDLQKDVARLQRDQDSLSELIHLIMIVAIGVLVPAVFPAIAQFSQPIPI